MLSVCVLLKCTTLTHALNLFISVTQVYTLCTHIITINSLDHFCIHKLFQLLECWLKNAMVHPLTNHPFCHKTFIRLINRHMILISLSLNIKFITFQDTFHYQHSNSNLTLETAYQPLPKKTHNTLQPDVIIMTKLMDQIKPYLITS